VFHYLSEQSLAKNDRWFESAYHCRTDFFRKVMISNSHVLQPTSIREFAFWQAVRRFSRWQIDRLVAAPQKYVGGVGGSGGSPWRL